MPQTPYAPNGPRPKRPTPQTAHAPNGPRLKSHLLAQYMLLTFRLENSLSVSIAASAASMISTDFASFRSFSSNSFCLSAGLLVLNTILLRLLSSRAVWGQLLQKRLLNSHLLAAATTSV